MAAAGEQDWTGSRLRGGWSSVARRCLIRAYPIKGVISDTLASCQRGITGSSAWSRKHLEANRSSDTVENSRTNGRVRPEPAGDLDLHRAQEELMPTPGVEPRFYTLEDVATILNVRVAQVYALVRSGELPAVKLGGRGVWRVDRLQLDVYIERMHEQTADWARRHPLIGAPEED
jgi:excisionase family DNA binding protein